MYRGGGGYPNTPASSVHLLWGWGGGSASFGVFLLGVQNASGAFPGGGVESSWLGAKGGRRRATAARSRSKKCEKVLKKYTKSCFFESRPNIDLTSSF